MRKINTVIIYSKYTDTLSYYNDWLDAFKMNEAFDLIPINAFDPKNKTQNSYKKIENAQLIILHHSLLADTLNFLAPFKQALLCRKGTLLSFVGNEVNLPGIQMNEKIETLKSLAPNYIATQLLKEAGDWLYNEVGSAEILSLPHALNPLIFNSKIQYDKRPIDVGCRTAQYGVYLGDNDRNKIIHYFKQLGNERALKVDLGVKTEQRFNRNEWSQFLNNCKATISTEAGSFYLEKQDTLVKEILQHFRKKGNVWMLPQETAFLVKLYRYLVPKSIRSKVRKGVSSFVLDDKCLGDEMHFEEVWEKFFKTRPKAPVYTKCISSRHFDALGTRTLQILLPGRFNDILIPNVHYLQLNQDFSNVENILSVLFDRNKVHAITEEAYQYAMKYHTYEHRIAEILQRI